MEFLTSLPRSRSSELIEQAGLDPSELRESLRAIERLNRRFGGTAAVLHHLDRVADGRGSSVLDAGTGGADIPRTLVLRARRACRPIEVVACDNHPGILQAAVDASPSFPEIRFERGDALNLPFPDRHFDAAICSLLAHHLDAEGVVRLCRELDRLTRRGFVLLDLERTRRAWAGVWLATRLVRGNRLTCHDGPLSVLRAYTLEEMRGIVRRADCRDVRVLRYGWFRLLVVQEKPS